ncbi:MAG: DNA mismatch repair endonuclease MutL [Aquificae bacterium]|nr:DNA mismatch repair endonuclease MutL [Aquificota bacterium]
MFVELLPPSVRRLIAAGEVVESPADVVKELIENALDAQASRVEVELIKGGKKLIKVTDDGTGIHPEDLPKVVLEGATSKIRTAEDLLTVNTYGFRGEALHAVSSVSRFTIRSRHFSQKEGLELRVEGGKAGQPVRVGMLPGTTVKVEELFFNVPARRKFLKKEDAERRKVLQLVQEYALARPSVSFSLTAEGRTLLRLKGSDHLRRAEELFELSFEEERLEEPPVSLRLLLARNVKRGKYLVFINDRPVDNRQLKEQLRRLFGTKSVVILYAHLPPYLVDVNVHPKKREVRLRRERTFYELLRRLVKGSFSSFPTPEELLASPRTPYRPTYELVGQLDETFLVVREGEFVYFLDQHLIHERYLYEKTGQEEKACRASVKAGKKLTREEQEELFKLWRGLENPHVCPHGRPIYWRVPLKELYERVGRKY